MEETMRLHKCPASLVGLPVTLVLTALATAAAAAPGSPLPAPPVLISGKPGNVFQASQPTVFQFSRPVARIYHWRVANWRGRLVASGVTAAGRRRLALPALPLGYYQVRLKAPGSRVWSKFTPLARVADPALRQLNSRSPFCVESAQSLLTAPDFQGNKLQPPRADLLCSRLEHLAGVTMVRDLMWWGWGRTTNPRPGVYAWGRYRTTINQLARRGIRVLEGLDPRHPPVWVGGWGHDLMALYRYARAAARRFASRVAAWEVGNEEDMPIAAGHCSTWTYAAVEKVADLGLKAGNPHVQVLNGPIALVYPHRVILRLLLQNGMGDYFNVFDFHDYAPVTYHQDVATARALLARYGFSKPIWATETGLPTVGGGRPLQPGSGLREDDAAQARKQAEAVVKDEVSLRALGVARIFFFVLPPYNEGGGQNVWGLLRWNWTVKPGYVALANLTAQLGDSRYLGPLDLGAGVHGYLFQQLSPPPRRRTADAGKRWTGGPAPNSAAPGSQTLVVWAARKRNIVLPAIPARIHQLQRVNLMGSPSTLSAGTHGRYHLMVGVAPIYVNGLRGLQPSAAPPAAARPSVKSSGKDLATVLRVKLGRGFRSKGNYATLEKSPANAVIEVYNFSAQTVRGRVRVRSAGWMVNGMPRRLSVPPMSHVDTPVAIQLARVGKRVWRRHPLRRMTLALDGHFAGRPVDPVAIPISRPFAQLTSLFRCRALRVTEPALWSTNASGKMSITSSPRQHAVRFHVVFAPHVDHWVYPDLRLRLPGENLGGSVAVSFQVKREALTAGQAPPATTSNLLMAVNAKGQWKGFPYPLSTHWRTVYVLWNHFSPAPVVMLRIGCNPRQNDFTYWVRHLKVYYRKP
jgi:hypothetical protein